MATALGPNHQKPNASRKEKVKVATPKTTKGSDPAILEKNNTDGISVVEKDISPPVPKITNSISVVEKDISPPVPKIKNEAKTDPTCLHPNQPTSSEVSPVPKSAELRSAAIKWKSKLSVHDNGESKERKSPSEVALLEKNDSSVVSIGRESPRNHLTLNAEASDNEVGASPTRKLSLGDFVTQAVATTKEPDPWENMDSSTTGLAQSLPYVPVSLAYVCLLMNVVIPGLGTIIAGLSMMCCGEPRGQPDELFNHFTTNLIVGVSQFFTVTFFFVGWIWSISWGVYLVRFAEVNRLKKAEARRKDKTARIANTLWDR